MFDRLVRAIFVLLLGLVDSIPTESCCLSHSFCVKFKDDSVY